jgi:hypothetical protein
MNKDDIARILDVAGVKPITEEKKVISEGSYVIEIERNSVDGDTLDEKHVGSIEDVIKYIDREKDIYGDDFWIKGKSAGYDSSEDSSTSIMVAIVSDYDGKEGYLNIEKVMK